MDGNIKRMEPIQLAGPEGTEHQCLAEFPEPVWGLLVHLCGGVMQVATVRVHEAVTRIKEAFREMPGTQLNLRDAARLTGLEHDTCRMILKALEDLRFLRRRHDGIFVQRTAESPDC
jgi:hypothetical protein